MIEQFRLLPRQVPPLPNLLTRHEAPAQQSALQTLRDPLGVSHIRLFARHLLQVLRIDQHQLKLIAQHIPDRLPQHSRRFHRYLLDSPFREPARHASQFPRRGPVFRLRRSANP
jgi:hypothetical protein